MRERVLTLAAVGVAVVGFSVLGVVCTARTGRPEWLFLSLPFTAALFVVARFAPARYRIEGDGVHVDRRVGDLVVPYRTIRSVEVRRRSPYGVPLLASMGVFGHFGWCWHPALGTYRLYLGNTASIVWVATDHGWIALSPDRADEFVERVTARLRLLR